MLDAQKGFAVVADTQGNGDGAVSGNAAGDVLASLTAKVWNAPPKVGHADRRGNLYPAKQRPEQKIDAAVALMMAVGRAMAEDTNEGDLTDFLRNPLIA